MISVAVATKADAAIEIAECLLRRSRELQTPQERRQQAELDRITLPFDDDTVPSEAELHVAKAQLVGWLEGLIQGIQATLFAQQMAAQQQLANMRGQIGPGGAPGRPMPQQGQPQMPAENPDNRPGTYL